MATDNSDLDDFVFGSRQLIATLPDQVDQAKINSTMRFLLLTVGTSPEKLVILVNFIHEAAHHGTQAHLYLELFLQAGDHITVTLLTSKGNVLMKRSRLARAAIMKKCQEEHSTLQDIHAGIADLPTS